MCGIRNDFKKCIDEIRHKSARMVFNVFSSKFFPMEAVTFTIRNKIFRLFVLIECCYESWNPR